MKKAGEVQDKKIFETDEEALGYGGVKLYANMLTAFSNFRKKGNVGTIQLESIIGTHGKEYLIQVFNSKMIEGVKDALRRIEEKLAERETEGYCADQLKTGLCALFSSMHVLRYSGFDKPCSKDDINIFYPSNQDTMTVSTFEEVDARLKEVTQHAELIFSDRKELDYQTSQLAMIFLLGLYDVKITFKKLNSDSKEYYYEWNSSRLTRHMTKPYNWEQDVTLTLKILNRKVNFKENGDDNRLFIKTHILGDAQYAVVGLKTDEISHAIAFANDAICDPWIACSTRSQGGMLGDYKRDWNVVEDVLTVEFKQDPSRQQNAGQRTLRSAIRS